MQRTKKFSINIDDDPPIRRGTGNARERNIMANKKAKEALNQVKMQAASEVGVNLNQGYNGDLTARQAGSIGGQMVKKMIEDYENKASSGTMKQ